MTEVRARHEHSIREIDARGGDLRKVAAMHMELLDFGPMAGLGEPFVRKACYAMHMRDDTLRCALYEVDGEPAGFIAYTDRGVSFHREGLRKHWLAAGLALAESLIRDPRRLAALPRSVRVVLSRRSEWGELRDPLGEIVCIAVRRDFLARRYLRDDGTTISEALIRHAGNHLNRRGVDRMRALVDAPNKSALMLYHKLGATFERHEQAGEPMVVAWLPTSQAEG